MKALLLLVIFSMGLSAIAAEYIRVIKVKGSKGIVRFPKHLKYKKGDIIRIDQGVWQEKGLDGNGQRQYSIVLQASYGQTSESTESSGVTQKVEHGLLSTALKFGFNFRKHEFGPETSYLISTVDDEQTTTVALGGFYHFNFKDNKPGAELVPYAGPSMALISQDSENVKRDGVKLGVAAGARWFPINDHVALIGELRFDYSTLKANSAEITSTGVTLGAGIGSYF